MSGDAGLWSTAQLAAAAGASPRQVDHWVRVGVLRPVVPAAGSGSRRRFDFVGVVTGCLFAALSRRGVPVSQVQSAQLVASGRQVLAPGLTIELDMDVFAAQVRRRLQEVVDG